jgi:integrase
MISAASEPYRTLFVVAALTGARMSELCGLTWANVRLDELDDAELEFGWQVDRKGNLRATKTDGSARTVPIPRELAIVFAKHKATAHDPHPEAFVFATRSGRPLGQRNVARALRSSQRRATTLEGLPTFPILHQVDDDGRPLAVPRGALPSMHSFRHTVASRALLAGESVDEVAFLLGHRDGTVTRMVYVREVADARRRAMRRSRMALSTRARSGRLWTRKRVRSIRSAQAADRSHHVWHWFARHGLAPNRHRLDAIAAGWTLRRRLPTERVRRIEALWLSA